MTPIESHVQTQKSRKVQKIGQICTYDLLLDGFRHLLRLLFGVGHGLQMVKRWYYGVLLVTGLASSSLLFSLLKMATEQRAKNAFILRSDWLRGE